MSARDVSLSAGPAAAIARAVRDFLLTPPRADTAPEDRDHPCVAGVAFAPPRAGAAEHRGSGTATERPLFAPPALAVDARAPVAGPERPPFGSPGLEEDAHAPAAAPDRPLLGLPAPDSVDRHSAGAEPQRWLRRVAGLVVAAPAGAHTRAPTTRAAAATVPHEAALLCATEDARALAIATATLLARRARASTALACVWTATEPTRPDRRPSARPTARRLAGALSARGFDATACGRVAVVALPSDPAAAAAAAARACAVAVGPVVLAIGGPRDEAFDALLADQDRLLLLSRPRSDAAVATLAMAGLPPGVAASGHVVGLTPPARALAESGLLVPAALRRALDTRPPRTDAIDDRDDLR